MRAMRSPALESPSSAEWRATGLEPPVFLDPTGRRRRLAAVAGALLAALTVAWVAALLIGATGFGPLPLLRATRLNFRHTAAAMSRVHVAYVTHHGRVPGAHRHLS